MTPVRECTVFQEDREKYMFVTKKQLGGIPGIAEVAPVETGHPVPELLDSTDAASRVPRAPSGVIKTGDRKVIPTGWGSS